MEDMPRPSLIVPIICLGAGALSLLTAFGVINWRSYDDNSMYLETKTTNGVVTSQRTVSGAMLNLESQEYASVAAAFLLLLGLSGFYSYRTLRPGFIRFGPAVVGAFLGYLVYRLTEILPHFVELDFAVTAILITTVCILALNRIWKLGKDSSRHLPMENIQEEALRVVQTAQQQGVTLRLLGGLAVRLHSESARHRSLVRPYPDIDFATPNKQASRIERMFDGLGYAPNKNFNLFNGDVRLMFFDEEHHRQIDVFVAQFSMCHKIHITERMTLDPLTLPLAELLLTKLQICEMNEKDIRDVVALLLDHPLGESDDETINIARMCQLTGDDWGLWKTSTLSLAKVRRYLETVEMEKHEHETLRARLGGLEAALKSSPKSMKWKMRDRVGEKVKWYELPEEVRRG